MYKLNKITERLNLKTIKKLNKQVIWSENLEYIDRRGSNAPLNHP